MALQLFADGAVVYDSRLEDYALAGLKTTSGLNKGGTAEFIMPPGHPAYNSFISYRTIVTLRENGVLRFRGRALYPSDDFYNFRTITCEGERCFLRDAVIRPYTFTADPASIFSAAVALYNAEVDEFKRFTPGVCTVTDANDYIRLESEDAETFADFFDKLVERCGGYITFTDAPDGGRQINWLAEIDSRSDQVIEFGENLLEFARSGQSEELATAVLPYGAQLEDGTRVTIKGVNGGKDYIEDAEAVTLRGRIMATVYWDDVTDPHNLLTKAREWLNKHKLAVISLQLTAADLSRMDKRIDSYQVGDRVKVTSTPHGVDDWFQLTERTTDWLVHDGGSINLGQTVNSLTGADIVTTPVLNRAVNNVKTVVIHSSSGNAAAVKQTEETLRSEIKQLADSITLEVSGSLGGTASIKLNVNGDIYEQSMDLTDVRKAFANDTTAITIQAGSVTFNAGTFAVNSTHFQVDPEGNMKATSGQIGGWTLLHHKLYAGDGETIKTVAIQAPQESTLYVFAAGGTSHDSYADCPFRVTKHGKLYATDAIIHGDIITIDGVYKTEMDRGSLRLYYDDVLCGTINTKYWSGAATEGISLRVEEGGNYIMFSHADDTQGSGYTVDYYLNAGWSDYEEMHIFQTSARFLDGIYVSGPARIRSLRLFDADGEYLVGINDGKLTASKL